MIKQVQILPGPFGWARRWFIALLVDDDFLSKLTAWWIALAVVMHWIAGMFRAVGWS